MNIKNFSLFYFLCFAGNLGEDCEGVNVAFNEAPPPSGTPSLENSLSPTDNGN